MNVWVKLYRLGVALLIILLCIGAVCLFLPKCNRIGEMQREKLESQEQIREKEAQIKEMQEKQEKFSSDPKFVERTARDIGMIKPDETVFKFTNEQSRSSSDSTE